MDAGMTLGVVFTDPGWLWAAALGVPCALAAWSCFDAMSGARRWSAILARGVLLVLIAAMLAGANARRDVDRVAVVGVIDLSESARRFGVVGDSAGDEGIGAWAKGALGGASEGRRPDDALGLIAFDGRALVSALPARANVLDRSVIGPGRSGTDVESGMRLAAGLVPPDASGRVVLFTDGNQTAGDARRAAAEIGGAGPGRSVRIDVVPISYALGAEVVVESVDAPARSVSEAMVPVRVTVRATAPASGTVRLTREGEIVDANGDAPGDGLRVQLEAGTRVITIPVRLPRGRVHRFEAVFEPDLNDAGDPVGDRVIANNRAGAFTLTPSRGRVLVVDGVSDGAPGGAGSILADTVRGAGIEVDVVSPFAMAGDLLALDAYDLVVLQDVPAEDVPEQTQLALTAYVRDLGGGMVMVGGQQSFGAGGWKGTPVADVLPVLLDLPDTILVPEAAVVFVLDSSGSMGHGVARSARTKQAIANESAALAMEMLDERDLVGAIAFNSTTRVVVPLGPNDDPERAQAAVRSIGSGGGTFLPPALERAHREFDGVEAKVKQVIVLSDGQSEGSERVPEIAAAMRRDGIRVSTIAVGDEADHDTMSRAADAGGGSFYAVSNPRVLPQVFLKAVRVVRRPLIREQAFTPVLLATGSSYTEGFSSTPELGGLVLTRAREEATVTYAMATPGGEPVLAHWAVGLGQVVAFTSDAHAWAGAWLDWDGYARFWTGVVRQASRAPADSDAEMSVTARDGEVAVRLEAYAEGGSPLDGLTVPADVYAPDGTVKSVTLRQTGAGVYEGAVRMETTGTAVVIAKPARGATRLAPVLGGASVSDTLEFARLEPDMDLIRDIARLGGGRVLSAGELAGMDLFAREDIEPRRALTPLWPVLMWWAMGVFLVDVGTRRVAWDRLVSRRYGADLRAAAAEAVQDRSRQAAGALAGIKRGREGREPAKPVGGTPGALGEDDARRTARDQLRERARVERERLRSIREQAREASGSDGGKQETPAPPTPTQPEAESGTEGLLAAKRRAARRYEGDDPGVQDG